MTEVFQSTYHFKDGAVGLAYLGIGIGMFLGLLISGATSDRLVIKLAERNGGQRKPEYRLPLMVPAALTVPIGLFMYGWSAQYAVHWIVPIIGTGFVGLGLITTFVSFSPMPFANMLEILNKPSDACHNLPHRLLHHFLCFCLSSQHCTAITCGCVTSFSWTLHVRRTGPWMG